MNEHRELEEWTSAKCPRNVKADIVDEFQRVLSDAADERPLQAFLAMNGALLSRLVQPSGGGFWCIDRPRLGAELVPDFLLASTTSAGVLWTMVELESPTERPLTKAGLPAAKLAEALKQIRDWRSWIRENIAYAHGELGLKGLDAECDGVVVIGRRASLDQRQTREYHELSTPNTTVMTYDRLVDQMKAQCG